MLNCSYDERGEDIILYFGRAKLTNMTGFYFSLLKFLFNDEYLRRKTENKHSTILIAQIAKHKFKYIIFHQNIIINYI